MPDLDQAKLRLRVLDQAGQPVQQVAVELLKWTESGAKSGGKTPNAPVTLRSLSTSQDGFVIFSISSISNDLKSTDRLSLRVAQDPELVIPVSSGALKAGSHYQTFALDHAVIEGLKPIKGPWHDDGLDADDIWAIPSFFPDLGPLEFGDDRCGRLIPNDQTVRVSHHQEVVRTRKNVVTCLKQTKVTDGRGNGSPGHHGIELGTTGASGLEVHLHEGELINYEIRSTRLGYTYGDLLYSLPLAPCESVTLAISSWEQRQSARAEQESVATETQQASYQRRNALSEAMGAVSSSRHFGWAAMAGNSSSGTGSGSGIIKGFLVKVAGAFQTTVGASASGSYDRKQFAANSTRSFSDSIQSSAEAFRRDHQVVILEQSETESQQISYRTVCNNNHCHVLNIFYHEVLTNYRISTRALGHQEVYLVPYVVQHFDAELALCARPKLLPFLLDESLRECFEKLDSGGGQFASTLSTVDKFRIEFSLGSAFGAGSLPASLLIKLKDGSTQTFAIPGSNQWNSGQAYSYDVGTTDFDPSDLHEVGFFKKLSTFNFSVVVINSFSVSVQAPNGQWIPIATGGPVSRAGGTITAMAPVSYSAPNDPAAVADSDCLRKVLAHLNCNAHYYNSLLWLLEDPNERYCRFDKVLCGSTGNSLADLILTEPLAVVGCSVAFAKADSAYRPFDGPQIVDERLLTLPTPGIFADAALGQCSACETKDDGVYWDWKDSPCACGGKDVQLKAPVDTPLLQPGVAMFPTMATTALATGVTPPSGDPAASNSLVDAFGSELAKAIMASGDSSDELTQLSALLVKMTEAVKELTPKPDDPIGDGADSDSEPSEDEE